MRGYTLNLCLDSSGNCVWDVTLGADFCSALVHCRRRRRIRLFAGHCCCQGWIEEKGIQGELVVTLRWCLMFSRTHL